MKGQALITLLFFTVIAVTVTSAAVIILMVNSLSGSKFQQGELAYEIAVSGAEEAKLRILRDPDYTNGPLAVGNGTAEITINKNGNQYTIISKGTVGNFIRQIQVDATYENNLLTINSQQEIY